MDDYVRSLCQEIRSRRQELAAPDGLARVRTIYIGGGTPSLLSPRQLDLIFEAIHDNYVVEADAEVTVEMNPEDTDPPPALPCREGVVTYQELQSIITEK